MSDFTRYGIYYLPPAGALADFGANWLGWDVDTGTARAHPECGLPVAEITATPRKYGFHATLKPPFRVAAPHGEPELLVAIADLCDSLAPVTLKGLALSHVGRFIALTAVGEAAQLNALAAACVTELDQFRAPAPASEIARRQASGLSARQEQLLARWGYPYVLDEFRFHMTLSGKLDDSTAEQLMTTLAPMAGPALPAPFVIDEIALVGERLDGKFQTVQRFKLLG